jgi:hypothetical protein
MKRTAICLCAFHAVLVAGVFQLPAVYAQPEQAQVDIDMDTLRAGVPTDRDNSKVDNWINKELTSLRTVLNNPILVPGGVRDFRKNFDSQYNHENNAAQFKKKLAERIGVVFAGEYGGQALNEVVGRAMSQVLLDLRDIDTREALFAGLTATDQVVRYRSAQTLIKLHPAIVGDAALLQQTLTQLRQAAPAAANGVVAAVLYQAAAIDARAAEAVPAVLDMMDARLTLLRQGPAELDRGEVPAIAFLDRAEQAGQLTADLRTQAVQRLAPLLRIHTERYGAPGATSEEKLAIAETIVTAEALLTRITKPDPAPSISRVLQGGAADAAINMQIELIQWIGEPQVAGVLNKAPWNVPAGAP